MKATACGTLALALLTGACAAGCASEITSDRGGVKGGDDDPPEGLILMDGGRDVPPRAGDGGVPPGADGGPRGGADGGPGDVPTRDTHVPLDADRPVDIMAPSRLAMVASRVPRVADAWLRGVLESADTMWYDHQSIVPGYQDSFGDNVVTPIGMRPNTIRAELIDLAVPGGHGWIFESRGVFHFPFGRPTGAADEDIAVVDFWQLPRDEHGELRPVVWWRREPNGITHRVEWMFPRGTVLGEMLFVVGPSGGWWPFEIRTRVRELERWAVDLFRPFPTAESFADALERKRAERPEWESSADIDALIAHARDPGTLSAATLSASAFPGAFEPRSLAEDVLPGLSDPTILEQLLRETPFRSVRGTVWKTDGALTTYGPTTHASFSIVPRGYTGGFLRVDEESCQSCHRDAGRPFRDWYPDIIAYGELWGEDDAFSWHPFETSRFVDSSGAVVSFNHDNREIRSDFVAGGVIEPYDRAVHPDSIYGQLPGDWKGYAY